jgi:glycosyltransferase involved in cell wall biosynthesis
MRRVDAVLVCQRGAQVDAPIKYGAARAMIEVGRELLREGRSVLLIGLAHQPEGQTEGVPFLGAPDERGVLRLLRRLGPIEALIGCSRTDIFAATTPAVALVYHHGPHVPEGEFALQLIRRLQIPVVVVSEHSLEHQRRIGVPAALLHLVRNGYDRQLFRPPTTDERASHRLVFAGMGVPYKGLDTAVAAFAMLKRRFADAEFEIYGSSHEWGDVTPRHDWRARWLSSRGAPMWTEIERDLPGLSYRGPVAPSVLAQAFQRASLLVMPSRIEETFGIVSVEAQACGCLPVLPHQGGFPETMQVGLTGYSYEPNTAEELARRIADLWEAGLPTPEQRYAASAWTAQRFSWMQAAMEVRDILDQSRPRRSRFWPLEAKAWRIAARAKTHVRAWRTRLANPRSSVDE